MTARDPIARALASCTPVEARIVWEAITQWIDNTDPEREDSEEAQAAMAEQLQAAVALRDRLDAAAASFAEVDAAKVHQINAAGTPLCGSGGPGMGPRFVIDGRRQPDRVSCLACRRIMWRTWGIDPPEALLSKNLGGRPKKDGAR